MHFFARIPSTSFRLLAENRVTFVNRCCFAKMSSAAAPAFLAEFPSVERVSWKRADGSDVPGYAVGPKGAPAVVAIQVNASWQQCRQAEDFLPP